jgi:hypothetical protein
MSTRERPQDRRRCETFEFAHGQATFKLTVGLPGRAHCRNFPIAKEVGSTIEAIARDAAVTVSIALQIGADLGTIRAAAACKAHSLYATKMGIDRLANHRQPSR